MYHIICKKCWENNLYYLLLHTPQIFFFFENEHLILCQMIKYLTIDIIIIEIFFVVRYFFPMRLYIIKNLLVHYKSF